MAFCSTSFNSLFVIKYIYIDNYIDIKIHTIFKFLQLSWFFIMIDCSNTYSTRKPDTSAHDTLIFISLPSILSNNFSVSNWIKNFFCMNRFPCESYICTLPFKAQNVYFNSSWKIFNYFLPIGCLSQVCQLILHLSQQYSSGYSPDLIMFLPIQNLTVFAFISTNLHCSQVIHSLSQSSSF